MGVGVGCGDWVWGLGVGIGCGDWVWGLGVEIGWGSGVGIGEALTSLDMVATMTVLQLPPRESRNTEVIIELRYGTNLLRSCRAMMT